MPPIVDTAGLNCSLIYDAIEALHPGVDVRGRIAKGLKPIAKTEPVIGEAWTMRLTRLDGASPDNRMRIMQAYDKVPRDAVLVIQGVGDLHGAVIGDVLSHRLKKMGVLAIIADGPVRDIDGIEKYGPPTWAAEVNMAGMLTVSVGVEIQVPVVIGGASVKPGDLIAADADGVIVSPAAEIGQMLDKARAFQKAESESHRKIAAGADAAASYLPKS